MEAEAARFALQLNIRRRRAYRFGALCLTLALAGCLGDFLTTPSRSGFQPSTLRRLVITPDTATLDAFDRTASFAAGWLESAAITPAGRCTWSVGDPGVASISDDGTVRARNNGMTAVRATCGDTTATAAVRVWQAVMSIRVDPDEVDLDLGESDALHAEARDGNDHLVTRPVTFSWISSDDLKVSVASDADRSDRARATRYFPGDAYVEARVEGRAGKTVID